MGECHCVFVSVSVFSKLPLKNGGLLAHQPMKMNNLLVGVKIVHGYHLKRSMVIGWG